MRKRELEGFLAGYHDEVHLATETIPAHPTKRWHRGYAAGKEKAREDLETRKVFVDPFPTEIAPEYLGQDKPWIYGAVRMGRRWYAKRFIPDGPVEFWEKGEWHPYSIAVFQKRERAARIKAALDQGGDDEGSLVAVPVEPERGAGESGSPLLGCRREFPERDYERCGELATHIVWGKLFDKDVLGPRCEDCLVAQCGWRALRDTSYAIYRLPVSTQPSPESGSWLPEEREVVPLSDFTALQARLQQAEARIQEAVEEFERRARRKGDEADAGGLRNRLEAVRMAQGAYLWAADYLRSQSSTEVEPTDDEQDQCAHTDQPHTVWWWNDAEAAAGGPPVPLSAQFDNQADALGAARKLIDNPQIAWAKVFRSDNENYTCWRWNRDDLASPGTPAHKEGH